MQICTNSSVSVNEFFGISINDFNADVLEGLGNPLSREDYYPLIEKFYRNSIYLLGMETPMGSFDPEYGINNLVYLESELDSNGMNGTWRLQVPFAGEADAHYTALMRPFITSISIEDDFLNPGNLPEVRNSLEGLIREIESLD